jgi:hypothetical protein
VSPLDREKVCDENSDSELVEVRVWVGVCVCPDD